MMVKRYSGSCLLMLLFLVIFLPIGLCAWIWVGYVSPYQSFRKNESEIVPRFDELNEAVAKSLPSLPDASIEGKRWSVGITNPIYDHGRWLFIYISTPMSTQEISSYYRQNLKSAGWNEYTQAFTQGIDLYSRNTSCLAILLPGQLAHYEIHIWHDFKGQSFSPPLPDLNYMQFAEMGETNFAVCPP